MLPLDAAGSREGLVYLALSGLFALLTALLALSTVFGYLHEHRTREAALAFGQDRPDARQLLLELREAHPDDPTPAVLLGSYEVERPDVDPSRAQAAERLFAQAAAVDPLRPSARVGLATSRLLQAEAGSLPERKEALEPIAAELTSAPGGADVDYLRGALELLRGDPAAARDLLGDEPRRPLGLPAASAWYWNRTAADLMSRDGAAVEHALRAFLLRPWPLPGEHDDGELPPEGGPDVDRRAAPAYMLGLALRAALADPGFQPRDPDAVRERCALAERALELEFSGPGSGLQGRFQPPREVLASMENAIGLGYFRIGAYAEAAGAFQRAAGATGRADPLYLFNLAEALYQAGLAAGSEAERAELLGEARATYGGLAEQLENQDGRAASAALAATNAAAIELELGDPVKAGSLYRRYAELVADEAERARTTAALYDLAGDRRCVALYERALELDHPEGRAIEARLGELRRR